MFVKRLSPSSKESASSVNIDEDSNRAQPAKQESRLCPGCKTFFNSQDEILKLLTIQEGRGGRELTYLGLHCNRCILLIALFHHLHLQNQNQDIEAMIDKINQADKEVNKLRYSIPVAKRFIERENHPSDDSSVQRNTSTTDDENDVESDIESDLIPKKPIDFAKKNDELLYVKVKTIIRSMVDKGISEPHQQFYKNYPNLTKTYKRGILSTGITRIVSQYKNSKEYKDKQNGIAPRITGKCVPFIALFLLLLF